jgi:hypothetical protein
MRLPDGEIRFDADAIADVLVRAAAIPRLESDGGPKNG